LQAPIRKTEIKVLAGYIAALLCIALISVSAFINLQRLALGNSWVAHTDQVISLLNQLSDAEMAADSAARGYAFAQDGSYLPSLKQATSSIDENYRRLRLLTTDNALQQQRLDELDPLIRKRQEALNAVTTSTPSPANARSGALDDAIHRLVTTMVDTERALLNERQRRAQDRTAMSQVALIAGGLIAFAFVSLSLLAMRRDFAGRRRAEADLREANARLEERVQLRTSELKAANELVERSERRFRAFVSATSNGIFRMNADWSEMHHLQGNEFTPDTATSNRNWIEKYIPSQDRDAMRAAVSEAIAKKSVFQLEHRIKRSGGATAWTYSRAVPLIEDGKIVEWFGAATDITIRRRAEERIYSQLAHLQLLGEITRSIGERHDVNSIFQVVLRTLEEQLPIDFACICNFDAAANQIEVVRVGVRSRELSMNMALTEQARFEIDQNGLARCCHRDQLVYEPDIKGSPHPFAARLAAEGLRSLVIAPLSVGGKVAGLLAIARRDAASFQSADCEFIRQLCDHLALAANQSELHASLQRAYDDLRTTQQVLMEQERLRALGQMASGIAHDINNALSPAALYVQSLLETDTSLSTEARAYLTITERSIQDVAATIARLREFYRPREQGLASRSVDLNLLLQQVIDLTQARWRDMPQEHGFVIQTSLQLAVDLPAVSGSAPEFRDGLTNLILNAIDAMPAGGTLTVRSSTFAQSVIVEIGDTGVGMSEEVRQRCLEPFYTTKGERGTGLGLAMVYGMAQRHGAEMEIDSQLGRGTTVRLIFPADSSSPDATGVMPILRQLPLRLLVVDDDPLLLRSLTAILERDGHIVCAADGGQAGIDEFFAACERQEFFDAVITDLGMPTIDGRAVASVVRARVPTTTIILLTGWGHRLQGELKPEYVDCVLNKPPKINELRAALLQAAKGRIQQ
jgi:signal transduction histidine kinase/CHASE3 domain sensor protein/ActR/RegA family two-component response regulator